MWKIIIIRAKITKFGTKHELDPIHALFRISLVVIIDMF
jgi:hypothetical protein